MDYVRDEVADRMMERLLVGGLYAVWRNLSKAIRA